MKLQNLKHSLIDIFLIFIKILRFFYKTTSLIFTYLIFKPLNFIFGGLFSKLLVRLYSFYILSLKRIREIGKITNAKLYLIKKFSSPILIILLSLPIIISNLKPSSDIYGIPDRMYQAMVASLFKNEFSDTPPEELIVDSGPATPTCATSSLSSYQNPNWLTPSTQLNTNTSPIPMEQPGASCLNENSNSLLQPTGLLPSGSIGSNTSNPIETANNQSRTEIVTYTVKSGDTISRIASSFGITANTILWANNLKSTTALHIGDKIKILPVSGVLHKVVKGETIKRISTTYGVTQNDILKANNLSSTDKLKAGQQLLIPNGRKITLSSTVGNNQSTNIVSSIKNATTPPSASKSSAHYQWPAGVTRISQYYSWRHTGVDIAGPIGTPLYAAEDGVVETSGWNSGGYGNMILVNHGGGNKTRYAHASKLLVSAGQKVARGQVIALMGSTGRSTGPHLHFELYIANRRVNPLSYIR